MLSSLRISESKLKLKNFRELRWKSSTMPSNNRVETFWVIRTNFRLEQFLKYMKMKKLIEGLEPDELQMLVDAPGILKDNLFLDALRALEAGISLKTLELRLQKLTTLGLSQFVFNINLYHTLKGVLRYQIFVSEKPIGKIKRFSGYVRNSSAVGSKRSRTSRIVPETTSWNINVEYDFYHYLTVGELTTGTPGRPSLILTSSKERNG